MFAPPNVPCKHFRRRRHRELEELLERTHEQMRKDTLRIVIPAAPNRAVGKVTQVYNGLAVKFDHQDCEVYQSLP
jgi:hypothetical protein